MTRSERIKVVILCGGRGYRLKEETEFKPKPMVEVGGQPILWHIMNIYSYFGFNDFIIALGYKGNVIKDYFANKKYYDGDFMINSRTNKVKHYGLRPKKDFKVTLVDTGLESLTGERVRRIKNYIDNKNFMVTYGDGLSNVNIRDLYKFHLSKKVIATITGVHPYLRFGGIISNGSSIVSTYQKRVEVQEIINGGFMVFSKKIFDYISPNSMIEDVFPKLVGKKKLAVFKHSDFWRSMDTVQDMEELNTIWENHPKWKVWD